MNAPACDRGDAGLSERLERLENDRGLLMALIYILGRRVDELEGAPATTIAAESATTLKGGSYTSGYSQSTLRKWIKSGKISAERVGGRVIVDKRTLPPRRAASTKR